MVFCKKCKQLIKDEYNFCPICGKETHPEPKTKVRRPKGSGCVSKLSGRRNKPYRAIKNGICLGTFKTEREASLCLLQYQDKTVTSLESITLKEIYEKWMNTEWYSNLSKSMKDSYKSAWTRLSVYSGEKFKNLKTSHYQSAIDKIKGEGYQRDTCEKLRSLISVLCQYAISDDIIDRNYSEGLRLPEKTKFQRRNFTDEEILTLFYNDRDQTARIILCLIYTGMREGELFSMLKENVFLDKKYMVGGSKTDSGKNRVIPIRTEIVDYITDFYNSSVSNYLISNSNGKPIDRANFIKRKFYPLLEKLKIQYTDDEGNHILTPHRARHTYIAENIKAGVKPEILTKIVGHSNYSTSVDKYNDYLDIDYILSQTQKGL